jgi:hypothetical protein
MSFIGLGPFIDKIYFIISKNGIFMLQNAPVSRWRFL